MSKEDSIRNLKEYLTGYPRLYSAAMELELLIKMADEHDEPDSEQESDQEEPYAEMLQVHPEELAAAQREKDEAAEEVVEEAIEKSEPDKDRKQKRWREYFDSLSEEHVKYFIGNYDEGIFGMPPIEDAELQKHLYSDYDITADDYVRLAMFFSYELDKKYPQLALQALNKLFTMGGSGASLFFSLKLDERYPNSAKNFFLVARESDIGKYNLIERYSNTEMAEYLGKRIERLSVDEMIHSGSVKFFPKIYAEKLSKLSLFGRDRDMNPILISEVLDVISENKEDFLDIANNIAKEFKQIIDTSEDSREKSQAFFYLSNSKIAHVYPEVFSEAIAAAPDIYFVQGGFYKVDSPERSRQRLSDIAEQKPHLIFQDHDLMMNSEFSNSALKNISEKIGVSVYDPDDYYQDDDLGLSLSDFLYQFSSLFSEPDKYGNRNSNYDFLKSDKFKQFYLKNKEGVDAAFSKIMEKDSIFPSSSNDREGVENIRNIIQHGLDDIYPNEIAKILNEDLELLRKLSGKSISQYGNRDEWSEIRSSVGFHKDNGIMNLLKKKYPDFYDKYASALVRSDPSFWMERRGRAYDLPRWLHTMDEESGELLIEPEDKYLKSLAEQLSSPMIRTNKDGEQVADYDEHMKYMFTIHGGYFHESFPEQAKKAAIYLSENEPFEYFELGIDIKLQDDELTKKALSGVIEKRPDSMFTRIKERPKDKATLSLLYPESTMDAILSLIDEEYTDPGDLVQYIETIFNPDSPLISISEPDRVSIANEIPIRKSVKYLLSKRGTGPKERFFSAGTWRYFKKELGLHIKSQLERIQTSSSDYEKRDVAEDLKGILFPKISRTSYTDQDASREIRGLYPELTNQAILSISQVSPYSYSGSTQAYKLFSGLITSSTVTIDGRKYLENSGAITKALQDSKLDGKDAFDNLKTLYNDYQLRSDIYLQRLSPEDGEGRPYIDDAEGGELKKDVILPLIIDKLYSLSRNDSYFIMDVLSRPSEVPDSPEKVLGALLGNQYYAQARATENSFLPDLVEQAKQLEKDAVSKILEEVYSKLRSGREGAAKLFLSYMYMSYPKYRNIAFPRVESTLRKEIRLIEILSNVSKNENISQSIIDDVYSAFDPMHSIKDIDAILSGNRSLRDGLLMSIFIYSNEVGDYELMGGNAEDVQSKSLQIAEEYPEFIVKYYNASGETQLLSRELVQKSTASFFDNPWDFTEGRGGRAGYSDKQIRWIERNIQPGEKDIIRAGASTFEDFERRISIERPDVEAGLRVYFERLAKEHPTKFIKFVADQEHIFSQEMDILLKHMPHVVEGGLTRSTPLEKVRTALYSSKELRKELFDIIKNLNSPSFNLADLFDYFEYEWFADLFNQALQSAYQEDFANMVRELKKPSVMKLVSNERIYNSIKSASSIVKRNFSNSVEWIRFLNRIKGEAELDIGGEQRHQYFIKQMREINPSFEIQDIIDDIEESKLELKQYATFDGFISHNGNSSLAPIKTEIPSTGELSPNVWSEKLGLGHGNSQEELNWLISIAGSIDFRTFLGENIHSEMSDSDLTKILDFYFFSDLSRYSNPQNKMNDSDIEAFIEHLDRPEEFRFSYLSRLMSEKTKLGNDQFISFRRIYGMSKKFATSLVRNRLESHTSGYPLFLNEFLKDLPVENRGSDGEAANLIKYLIDSGRASFRDGHLSWTQGDSGPVASLLKIEPLLKRIPSLYKLYPSIAEQIVPDAKTMRDNDKYDLAKSLFPRIKNEPIEVVLDGQKTNAILSLPDDIKISRSIYQSEQRPGSWVGEPRMTVSSNNVRPTKILYDIGKKLIHAGDGVVHTNVGISGFTNAWALTSVQDGHYVVEQYQSDYPVFLAKIFNAPKSNVRDYQDIGGVRARDAALSKNEKLKEDYPDEYKDARKHFSYISIAYPYIVLANSIRVAMAAGYQNIYVLKNAAYYANIASPTKAQKLYEEIPKMAVGVGLKTIKGEDCWEIPANEDNIEVYERAARRLNGRGPDYDFSLTPSQNVSIRVEKRKDVGWSPSPEKIKQLEDINLSIKSKLPGVEIPKFFSPLDAIKFLNTQVRGRILGKKRFSKDFGTIVRDLSALKRAWDRSSRLIKVSKMNTNNSRYSRIKLLNIAANKRKYGFK